MNIIRPDSGSCRPWEKWTPGVRKNSVPLPEERGLMIFMIIRMVVVFPAPLGPIRPTISPGPA